MQGCVGSKIYREIGIADGSQEIIKDFMVIWRRKLECGGGYFIMAIEKIYCGFVPYSNREHLASQAINYCIWAITYVS